MPASNLELAMWIQSDEVVSLYEASDEHLLSREKDVVAQEHLQNAINGPGYAWNRQLYQLLYPAGHPRRPSNESDVSDVTLAQLRDFARAKLVAGRLTLVLAGNLEPDRAFTLAETYFGQLPRGEARPALPAQAPLVARSEIATVRISMMALAWRGPDGDSDDLVPLKVGLEVLSANNGPLMAALDRVGPGHAVSCDVYASTIDSALRCDVGVTEASADGKTALAAIDGALADLGAGFDSRMVTAAARRVRLELLQSIEAIDDRATDLALGLNYHGCRSFATARSVAATCQSQRRFWRHEAHAALDDADRRGHMPALRAQLESLAAAGEQTQVIATLLDLLERVMRDHRDLATRYTRPSCAECIADAGFRAQRRWAPGGVHRGWLERRRLPQLPDHPERCLGQFRRPPWHCDDSGIEPALPRRSPSRRLTRMLAIDLWPPPPRRRQHRRRGVRPGEGISGFLVFEHRDDRPWVSQIGLLSGAAGIGLVLLAATSDVAPDWDEALGLVF